ncbi:hypothetical protein WA158_005730 [Blastocystis sp. Blastoise]
MFFKFIVARACSTGEYAVTLKRQYASQFGETVTIANAASSFLRVSYVFRDVSAVPQDDTVDYSVCLDGDKDYTIELSSKNVTAWANGSFVRLVYNQITLVDTRLTVDDNGKKTIKFSLSSILSSRINWKYSTSVDVATWKESKIEEWGEDYKNKEIKNSGVTTYFRKDIAVDESFIGLQLSIQSQSGFIVYINGIQVSLSISQNTLSQSFESIPSYKSVVVPKELFASTVSLSILKIAIELHTTADHPEFLSSFDVLTYINHSNDSLNNSKSISSSITNPRKLQSTQAHICVKRETSLHALYEQVVIKSEDGIIISTLIQNDNKIETLDYYGPIGIWLFELSSNVNSVWYQDSYITIYLVDDISNTYIPITKLRTLSKSIETYYINTDYSMLMQSEWKYTIYNEKPTEWYGSSVMDSTWSTTTSLSSSIPITTSNQYIVFRKTINTPSINNQKYFILKYKTFSNSIIYINNHEIAKYGFDNTDEQLLSESIYVEQTTTGPVSLFDSQSTITISILIFDNQHTIVPSFDASLLMVVDRNIPAYTDYEVTSKNAFQTDHPNTLVDFNLVSFVQIFGRDDGSSSTLSIQMKDGYKYITRYCISRSNSYDDVPISWTVESIDINGESHVHSEVTDAFSTPYTSNSRCFELSNVITGINLLEFTFKNNFYNLEHKDFNIPEIQFFYDVITPETLPLLYTKTPYIAYESTYVIIYFDNAEYYHDFTITPSLSDGLSFDTKTGSIFGTIQNVNENLMYTIQATSIFDTSYSYDITIQTQSCVLPMAIVKLQLDYDGETDYLIRMYDPEEEIYYPFIHLHEEGSENYQLCLNNGKYTLSLFRNADSYKHYDMYVDNKFYIRAPFTTGLYYFTLLKVVDSSRLPVLYSYDSVTSHGEWTRNNFDDTLWSSASSTSSLPNIPDTSITQYYRLHYHINSFTKSSQRLDITVSTYAGMIIYINGIEVRRVNIDSDTCIQYNTLATSEYDKYKSFKSIISLAMDPNILIIGDNVISIEIHKQNTIIQPSSQFSFSINYIDNMESSTTNGVWTSNGIESTSFPLYNLNDDNINSYATVDHDCVSTTFTYTNLNEIADYINYYEIESKNSLSAAFKPISFIIEGTKDNEKTWTLLNTQIGLDPSGYQEYISFNNKQSYTAYRFTATKCGVDSTLSSSATRKTVLNTLSFKFNFLMSCEESGWSLAYNNQYSYKTCPQGYISNAKRLCSNYELQEIEGDNICMKIDNSVLSFKERNILITTGECYEQYYIFTSTNELTITPDLPDGLYLDNTYQILYGNPTTPSPTTIYILSYMDNNNNRIEYDISITIKNPYCASETDWQQTGPNESVSLECPSGYSGQIIRLCNEYYEWEYPDYSGCVQCTGTTYYDGTKCSECGRGTVTTVNGTNVSCTPCRRTEFVHNNKCYPYKYCPDDIIDTFEYYQTFIFSNAIVNCTNENQYGYYQVLCDYIDNTPIWSDDINKEFCYSRPETVPGKVFQIIDYTIRSSDIINDVYPMLLTTTKMFVQTHPYQLTDLFITTSFNEEDQMEMTLFHIYYGSSADIYYSSDSFEEKNQLFINSTISSSTISNTTVSSLENTVTLHNKENSYCHLPEDNNIIINSNYYYLYSETIDSTIHTISYYCKQDKLKYIMNPAFTSYISNINNKIEIELSFEGIKGTWVNYNVFISIYRSLLVSINVPISQMKFVGIESSPDGLKTLNIKYDISFPEGTQYDTTNINNWMNKQLLIQKITRIIPFEFSNFQVNISNLSL